MQFTPEETEKLIQLLKKFAQNGYLFPTEECMRAAHNVISMWAVELVILRSNKKRREKEILLAVYEGGIEQFVGLWHIPGGYNKWQEPDIQATCSRIAMQEIDVDVNFTNVVDAYKWKTIEHPYGHPLSLYVRCELRSSIKETDKLRFFAKNSLPQNIVKPHQLFIEKYL